MKLNVWKTGYIGGALSAIGMIACVGWRFLLNTQVLKDAHLQLMQIMYPGFDLTNKGLAIGFGEAFLYGLFFGVLFAWLFNKIRVMEDK